MKLARRVLKLSGLEVNQAGVEVGQPHVIVECERSLQLREGLINFTTLVLRLAKQNMQLRAVATHRNHLLDDAIRGLEFTVLQQRERERIVQRRVLRLNSDDISQ